MLLKADHIGKVKILAITCVNGNTQVDNVTRNTIRILEFSNRTDVRIFTTQSVQYSNTPVTCEFFRFQYIGVQ